MVWGSFLGGGWGGEGCVWGRVVQLDGGGG